MIIILYGGAALQLPPDPPIHGHWFSSSSYLSQSFALSPPQQLDVLPHLAMEHCYEQLGPEGLSAPKQQQKL
jgi:hypothetical protein